MNPSTSTSPEDLFAQAQTVLASGVSAGARSNPYLGKPLFAARGEGPYLYGLDGKRYIDFNLSNGAALLGHGHHAVKRAVLQGVVTVKGQEYRAAQDELSIFQDKPDKSKRHGGMVLTDQERHGASFGAGVALIDVAKQSLREHKRTNSLLSRKGGGGLAPYLGGGGR